MSLFHFNPMPMPFGDVLVFVAGPTSAIQVDCTDTSSLRLVREATSKVTRRPRYGGKDGPHIQ